MAEDYLIVDCHNHLYPKVESGAGVRQMAVNASPGFETESYGLIEDAIENMQRCNIVKTFILPMMPIMMMRHKRISNLPEGMSDKERKQAIEDIDQLMCGRIQRLNRWACSVAEKDKRFVPFVIVDPVMGPDIMRQEIKELVTNYGAKGIGELAADQMGWKVDGLDANDPALWPIWETAIELDVPVLCHFGPSHPHPITEEPVPQHCPEQYDEVLDKFPELKLVEVHMNTTYDKRWPELWKPSLDAGRAFAKRHPNVICDISGNLGYGAPIEDLGNTIHEIGAERFIWGSDFLWINPKREIEVILQSDLTEKEKRLVLGENAVRFFDLKI